MKKSSFNGFVVILFSFWCFSVFAEPVLSDSPSPLEVPRVGEGSVFYPTLKDQKLLEVKDIVFWGTGNENLIFGTVMVGVVTTLELQLRDTKGVIAGKFKVVGRQIFFETLNPSVPAVLFATIGDSVRGDIYEDDHNQITIEMLGLQVVLEDSRQFNSYSLLLPDLAEKYFPTLQNISTVVPESVEVAKQVLSTVPAAATHDIERIKVESTSRVRRAGLVGIFIGVACTLALQKLI